MKKSNIEKMYLSGMTIVDISNSEKVGREKLTKFMRESGIEIRQPGRKRINIPLSDVLTEILIGEILGDGCLSMGKTNANAKFQWGGRSFEHGNFINDSLGDLASYFKPDRKYWKLCSRASESLTPLYNAWYRTGSKQAPKDLVLTPTIVRHWYIGDGYLKQRPNRKPAIIFSTQCFNANSLKILIKAFRKIGFTATPEKNNNRFVLRLPVTETEKLLGFIGACPFEFFRYKWLGV